MSEDLDYFAILAADYKNDCIPIDAPKAERWAYGAQKRGAKRRGIGWSFPFLVWLDWWGENFPFRGHGPYGLCMARYDDEGPYHPDNVYLATNGENWHGPRTKPFTPALAGNVKEANPPVGAVAPLI